MAATASTSVPYGSFGFKVIVKCGNSDERLGCFQEVSGLSATVNVTDLVVGGMNHCTKKLIGNATYSNITLKRGLCDGSMYDWIRSVIDGGKIERMTLKIQMLDEKNEVVKTFLAKRAIPIKWDGPSLSVMQDGIATESLEFAHEGLEVD